MTIKRHFFGKDCVIDRQLLNRDDVHHKMKEKGFVFSELLFLNQVHSSDVVVLDDVSKLYDYENLAKADALVTNLKNIGRMITCSRWALRIIVPLESILNVECYNTLHLGLHFTSKFTELAI